MLPILLIVASSAGWSWPTLANTGGVSARAQSAAEGYNRVHSQPETISATVYARQGKSIEAGNVVTNQAADTRPWLLVGEVAVIGTGDIAIAVHTQRSIVQEHARRQHKVLRPFKNLQIAFGPHETHPILGSYRCPDCGVFNDAAAKACVSCRSPRPTTLPRGSLTLAVAPARPATGGECGFLAVDQAEAKSC